MLALAAFGAGSTSPLFARDEGQTVYAFRNYSSNAAAARMILVGEIQSKSKVAVMEKSQSPTAGYDMRADQVTVRVRDRRGLKIGQKLYVIDKDPYHEQYRDGLIVGEITVTAIFHTPFYGWVLTGEGILLRVREGQYVARTLDTENLERAYALKKRGDHFANRGSVERAIASYNSALEADPALPEAAAGLGDLFLAMAQEGPGREAPVRALSEYARAWNNRINFRYSYEEYAFYRQYMQALLFTYQLRKTEASRGENIVAFLDRLLEVAEAAEEVRDLPWLRILSARAHYERMLYYSGQSSATERSRYDAANAAVATHLRELIDAGVRDKELYGLAILYYGRRYFDLRDRAALTQADRDFLQRLDDLIRKLEPLYRQYAGDSPAQDVLEMLERWQRA